MEKLSKIDISTLPKFVKEVFSAMEFYPTYLVGGAVRDIVLGIQPKDYDFATQAHPEQVVSIFENKGYSVIPTGIKYGTVTVIIGEEPIEITTFRRDVKYIDGRRPDVVEYSDDILEDLARRDFTMNAMSVDMNGNILDPYDGQVDLYYKELHTVGEAVDRFAEDKLRVMRMFRFCAKYDLSPHRSLTYALYVDGENGEELPIDITNLSVERVRDEFNKTIVCDNVKDHFYSLLHFDIIQQFVPEFNELYEAQNNSHHYTNVMNHTLDVIDKLPKNLELRLAGLFHDIGKRRTKHIKDGVDHFYKHHRDSAYMARTIMRRMKYSNTEIDRVCDLVYHHMIRYDKIEMKQSRRFLSKVGVDLYVDLIDLMIADRLAHNYNIGDLEYIYRLKFLCEKVIEEGQVISSEQLAINGDDLIEIGFKPGKIFKEILDDVKNLVIDNQVFNDKNFLISCVKDKYLNRINE